MDSKEAILQALYKRQGNYVSGVELAKRIGASRAAVWKDISGLKREGYPIKSAKRMGYTLARRPSKPLPFEVRWGLGTKVVGKEVVYFDVTGSTNDVAKEMAERGVGEGLVVIAGRQTKGRGRLGRSWVSQKGGLYLSIMLRPKMEPQHIQRLTLMAGLAAMKTIASYGLEASIKWVNDVRVGGKKVCGILTEVSGSAEVLDYAVVGIGMNVNNSVKRFPRDVRRLATSMRGELGSNVDLVVVVKRLLVEFDRQYKRMRSSSFMDIMREWSASCDTIGRRVRVVGISEVFEGSAIGVDEEGALMVEFPGGVKRVTAGDVVYLE